jgi:elongation factor Ts
MKVAVKKSERSTGQGVVETYIHGNGRIGAMVEVNCETDFVARTEQFRTLVHDIAMQIAAMDPKYVGDEPDAPTQASEAGEDRLLHQAFIKDPKKTIKDLVTETVGSVGENIRIRRFARFQVGG